METRFLVAWSGGLDSTYCLWWALNEMDGGYVTAKHIRLINRENRHEAEWSAIQRIIPLMKKYGEFDLSVSTLDVTEDTKIKKITDHFYCLPIIFGSALDCKTNIKTVIIFGYHNVFNILEYVKLTYKNVIKLHPKNIKLNIYSELLIPLYNDKKNISCNILPYELASQTHSCRKPKKINNKWLNCGNCEACGVMNLKQNSFTNKSYVDQIYKQNGR